MQREFSFSPAHLEAAHSCHQDSLHWGPHTSLSQSGHLDFHNHCPRKGELTISHFITYLWLHSSVWHKYPHRKTINYIMRTHPWKHITLSKQTGTPACPLSSKKGTGHLRVTAVLSGNYFMWQMTITCFIQTYSMILINFFSFLERTGFFFLLKNNTFYFEIIVQFEKSFKMIPFIYLFMAITDSIFHMYFDSIFHMLNMKN